MKTIDADKLINQLELRRTLVVHSIDAMVKDNVQASLHLDATQQSLRMLIEALKSATE